MVIAQMLAALGQAEKTRFVRLEAAAPIAWLTTVGTIDRAQFKAMMNLSTRSATRVLADLLKTGIVTSPSPRGPLELALPLASFRWIFPKLWPEAESIEA
jgi:Fic family protein